MSANTPVDRLMQTIRVHVPGVPEETIKLILFNTMDTFFRRTLAWRVVSDITLLADTTEYDIDLPANSLVVMAIGASHNGIAVPSSSGIDTTLFPREGAFSWSFHRPDMVVLAAAPTGTQLSFPLSVTFGLTVQRDVLEIDPGDWQLDDWMYDMFFDDWKNGAFATLYGMPVKPWSNPQLAVMHGKMWRTAMAQRKQQANVGFVYGKPAWTFPRWA